MKRRAPLHGPGRPRTLATIASPASPPAAAGGERAALYIDKPMKGHNLMQAIARVNRVFRGKPGGLVLDYIGIANELKSALKEYTASQGRGRPTVDAHEGYSVLAEKLDALRGMLSGTNCTSFSITCAASIGDPDQAREQPEEDRRGMRTSARKASSRMPVFGLSFTAWKLQQAKALGEAWV